MRDSTRCLARILSLALLSLVLALLLGLGVSRSAFNLQPANAAGSEPTPTPPQQRQDSATPHTDAQDPHLTLTLTTWPHTVRRGGTLIYTLSLTNTAKTSLTDLTITASVPRGFFYYSPHPAVGKGWYDPEGEQVVWEVPACPPAHLASPGPGEPEGSCFWAAFQLDVAYEYQGPEVILVEAQVRARGETLARADVRVAVEGWVEPVAPTPTPTPQGSPTPTATPFVFLTPTPSPSPTPTPRVWPSPTPIPNLQSPISSLRFSKSVTPTQAFPGQILTYTLALTNTGEALLTGLTVSDTLPDGLSYVPGSATAGQFDPRSRQLVWQVSALASVTREARFQARVRGDVVDDFIVNRAEVRGEGLAHSVGARATVAVARQAVITPGGGVLETPNGRVRVEFPAGAVDGEVHARYVAQPEQVTTTRFYVFELGAWREDGRSVSRFSRPVTLKVRYSEEDIGNLDPAGLRIVWFDEARGQWVPLPSQVDTAQQTITAQTDHLSLFGAEGTSTDMSGHFDPEVIPSLMGAQVSQFTGDATYEIPLYVPRGTGGLMPDLTLRYSSGQIADQRMASGKMRDREHPSGQPGWVGQGWSLDFGYIVRDTNDDLLGDAIDWGKHDYYLTMAGVSGKLVKVRGTNTYYPETAPGWRLEKIDGSRKGWWKATAPDGTKYIFGQEDDHGMDFVNWLTDDSPPPCYQAQMVTLRWYLSGIEDTSGNQVDFDYKREKRYTQYGDGECATHEQYVTAVYPEKVEYGLNPTHGMGTPRVVISFTTGLRGDYDQDWWNEGGDQHRFYDDKLDEIVIQAWNNATSQLEVVQRYVLEYHASAWHTDTPPEWLTLKRIRTVARNGYELPAIEFIYNKAWNDDGSVDGGDHHLTRKFLTRIDNGYGGKVNFTYQGYDTNWDYKDKDGVERNAYRYRVTQRTFEDGLNGEVMRYDYAYLSETGSNDREEFYGHAQTTETVYDTAWQPVAQTITEFHQKESDGGFDPRHGRPKKVTWKEYQSGSWVELRRVENTWGHAQAHIGVDTYQVVLVESNTIHRNSLRYRTLFLSDKYGNPRAEVSYGRHDGAAATVQNPGFLNMDNWTVTPQGSDVSADGRQLRMTGSTDCSAYQNVTVISGKTYEVWTWVRATAGTTAQFRLRLNNGSTNDVYGAYKQPGTEWELVRLEYPAAYNTSGTIRVYLQYQAGSGTIYVDNVSVTEVDSPSSGDERTMHRQYYPNESAWIVSKVAQETVYGGIKAEDDDTGKVAQTRYHYDATTSYPLSGTTPKAWNASPDYGLLSQVDAWDGSTYHATGYRYDFYGNREKVIDPRGNTTTTTYDSTFRAFPIEVENALNQVTMYKYYGVNGSGLGSTGAFFGKVESVIGPNGATTEIKYRYDVFGRMTEEYRPYDTSEPTVRVEYTGYCTAGPCTVAPPVKVRVDYREKHNDANAFRPILYFYDGLGRAVQTKAEKTNCTEMIVTNTRYDERGLVKEEYVPFKGTYSCGSAEFWGYDTTSLDGKAKTSYQYDALGRVTEVAHPDGTATTYVYAVERNDADPDFAGGREVVYVIDANQHFVRRSLDAYGRVQTVSESTGTYPNWGQEYRTRYAYDVQDNLTDVWDAAGNHTQVVYDRLGRKTQMTDPDMGTWSYGYDAAGNLMRQTDARNQTICFYYDALNRLKGKTYRTDPNCSSEDPGYGGYAVSYAYDNYLGDADAANSWGRRRVTWVGSWPNQTNKHEYQYDERGRVVTETVWLDGASYETNYTYYADDQVETIIYPDSEVITTTYTAQGLPDTLTGTLAGEFTDYPYVQSTAYNAWGQPTEMLLGSELTTQYVYHPLNSRLRRIQTGSLLDLHYAYDLVGNVAAIYDLSRGETLPLCQGLARYGYDPLDRLTAFEKAPSPLKPVTIRAKGSDAEGWPIMQLRVNGVVVQEWTVDTSVWADYTVDAPLTGDDQVDVVFTNDYCVPTGCEHGDRNLWVDYLVVGGQTVDVVTGTVEVDYDRGWGETAFDGQDVIPGQEGMYWAGALRTRVITGGGWTLEEGYSYNQIGNLTSKGGVSYTYPPSGPTSVRPHAVITTSAGFSAAYDEVGNMTSRDGATLTWDAETRLETVTEGGLVTTFTYDADGRRVKKTTPWGTTYYIGEHYEKHVPAAGLSTLPGDVDADCQVSVADIQAIAARWGEAWSLQYDVDQDGSDIDAGDIQTAAANWWASVPGPCNQATTKYYRLGGRLVALRQNGQLRYVHTDHLGSVSLLTDESGQAVPGSVQRFYPFGKTRTGQPVILPTEQNFTGQQLDANTGLLYYSDGTSYGRYYDPALGRFSQPDTLVPNPGDPQHLNRYSYAANNPLRYRDPTGHWFETAWDILNIGWDIYEVRRDPSLVNIGALVVDVGAAVLPFVPAGAGLVARGGKAAKAAVEVATHADEVADAAKAASKVEDVRHATQARWVQSVLNGIDLAIIRAGKPGRFGKAFYAAEEGGTAVAEVAARGKEASHVIRFQLDFSKAKVLDLTDPAVAKAWGYVEDVNDYAAHQALAQKAAEQGYNVIKYQSYRGSGYNYALLDNPLNPFNFEEWLIPQMVSPAAP